MALSLTACGGGGGGSSQTELSIDKKSMEFNLELSQSSDQQLVHVKYKGAGILIGYAPGVADPGWLDIRQQSETENSLTLSISVNAYAPLGVSTISIRFMTGKEDGTQIKIIDLPIKVNVKPSLGASNISSSSSSSSSASASILTSIAIDKQLLSFTTDFTQSPTAQIVHVTFKGDRLIVGTPPNIEVPNWLQVESRFQSDSAATIIISVNGNAPLGVSSTVVRFLTGRQDGTGIKTVDLPVTVTVNPGTDISVNKTELSLTAELGQVSDEQQANIIFVGDNVAVSSALEGAMPDWLVVTRQARGDGSILFGFSSNGLAPAGESSFILRFSTSKADGSQLKTIDLPIRLQVNQLNLSSAAFSGSFIYGADSVTENLQVKVGGSASEWSATSDQSWLNLVTATGVGNGTVSAKIDGHNLLPGSYKARLTVTAKNNPANSVTAVYTLNVQSPALAVDQSSLLLGGKDGLDTSPQYLSILINTGTMSYPYKVTFATDDGKNWLKVSSDRNEINASLQKIKLSADPTAVAGGIYTAKVKIEVAVGALTLTKQIPVTFNRETHRLVVSATGVAFSSLPNISLLTRDVKVLSTRGATDIPWTATSDQPWLNVTASGVTGAKLTLTANQGMLAAEKVHFANVTIKSTDAQIENQETIRVGFTISQVAATDLSVLLDSPGTGNGFAPVIVASPVEPLVFANINGSVIKAYNIYSGNEERSFSNVVAGVGGMTISGDGTRLYVYDEINKEAVEVDATTGLVLHKFSAISSDAPMVISSGRAGLAYMRPDARPVLVGVGPFAYDLSTQQQLAIATTAYLPSSISLTTTQDPALIVDYQGTLFRVTRSALKLGSLQIEREFSAYTAQGREGQACLNAEGTRIYTASGAPYNFPGTNIATQMVEQVLPGDAYPNSIICGWNGVIIGGASAYYSAEDIFIYDGDSGRGLGNKSSSTEDGYRSLVDRGLALSGDASRLASFSINTFPQHPYQIRFHTMPSLP